MFPGPVTVTGGRGNTHTDGELKHILPPVAGNPQPGYSLQAALPESFKGPSTYQLGSQFPDDAVHGEGPKPTTLSS